MAAGTAHLNEIIQENLGMAMVFTLVQAAKEWLRSEWGWRGGCGGHWTGAECATCCWTWIRIRADEALAAREKVTCFAAAPFPLQTPCL